MIDRIVRAYPHHSGHVNGLETEGAATAGAATSAPA